MVNIYEYLNTDLGNIGTVTKFVSGICLLIIAVTIQFRKNIVRADYSSLLALFCAVLGLVLASDALSLALLIQSSLETLMATLAIAIVYTLLQDKTLG